MATNETPATEQGGHTADVANEQPQTRLSVALARQTELLTELAAKEGTIRELREALRVAVTAVAKSERLMEIQAQRDSDEAEYAAGGQTYSYTEMSQAWNEADIAIVACKTDPVIRRVRGEVGT